jgi:flagellar biosynthesis protein
MKKPPKETLAIALGYDKDVEPAPHVVATGKGYIAEQIIAIAKENGVTVHKDDELAEILSVLDVDTIIPTQAYAAVAEILAYVYRTNARYRNRK